jgi:transposase InsO family protein
MYYKLNLQGLGRDAFEVVCKEQGLVIGVPSFRAKTTDSTGVIRFPNVLAAVEIIAPHQAWSSDITYFELNNRFYFITFIIDCFTRVIVGHEVSNNLQTTSTTLAAIKKAVKAAGKKVKPGLIFHSDGGGQYYAKEFVAFTAQNKMINSMCEMAYENGKAERINGVIKNNYLRHYTIKTFKELQQKVDRAVELYNYQKPHKALGYQTPAAFEGKCLSLHQQAEPTMTESLDAKSKCNRVSNPVTFKQAKPPIPDVLSANIGIENLQKTVNHF